MKTLTELQTDYYHKYRNAEWPTPQIEEWRRTNLRVHFPDRPPAPEEIATPNPLVLKLADLNDFGSLSGMHHPDLNEIEEAVVIQSNGQVLHYQDDRAHPEGRIKVGLLNQRYEESDNQFRMIVQNADPHSFTKTDYWHYAAIQGIAVDSPVERDLNRTLYVRVESEAHSVLENPHIHFNIRPGAEFTAVLHFVGSGDQSHQLNSGITWQVSENARFRLSVVQELKRSARLFYRNYGEVDSGGVFEMSDFQLGAGFVKGVNQVRLTGESAKAVIEGVIRSRKGDHKDVSTLQNHVNRDGVSNASFKSVVDRGGRSIYQGLIKVAEQGVGTDAYLNNKNLLLESGARADAVPKLEIGTNDVRCSHGSTSGKLDPIQLFYVMSRGFSEKQAKKMLINAFMQDLTRNVNEELRDWYTQVLEEAV